MLNFIKDKYRNLKISTQMSISFILIATLICVLLYFVLPIILNYPPDTINTQFDKEVSIIYYVFQYIIAVFGIMTFFIIYFKISLRKLDKWEISHSTDEQEILKIRKIALSYPYKLYIAILFLPVFITCIVLQLTGSHPTILLFKIGILIFSFSALVSGLLLIVSKNVFYPILRDSSKYVDDTSVKATLSLKTKLIFQFFPSVLVTALLISLIGYSRLIEEKGNLLNSYYSSTLDTYMSHNNDNIDDFFTYMENELMDSNDFCFIQDSNYNIITSNGTQLSHFFKKYMNELSESHDNRVYEAYTIDAQGVIQKLEINGEIYTIGIYYEIVSSSVLYYFLLFSLSLFLFYLIILIYNIRSIENDIKLVVNGFNSIILNSDEVTNTRLAITSDDIMGELSSSFNKIQTLTKNNIEQIHSNQDLLIEKERLASLGQMIGGIAHNLKTPIMSIAGAAEGLTDLVKEYDSSIGDPEVNEDDHHEIASDMNEWIEKIKTHTSYMSDVITAVKGQASTLSQDEQNTFTLEELVKRVNILMKHELKNALIELNVKMDTDPTISLNGNVNSLVQVINNMISNAIQSYNGEPNKYIDMTVSKSDNNIIISIQDYGCGMNKEVKDKLFKEMITTKGKNGTGLGLFMSYSTIRGHFNGNITFDSEEGKGTKFSIILPL